MDQQVNFETNCHQKSRNVEGYDNVPIERNMIQNCSKTFAAAIEWYTKKKIRVTSIHRPR